MKETSVGYLLFTHKRGPGPQLRCVSGQGIEMVTSCSQAGAQSTEPHQPGLMFPFNRSFPVL